MPADLDGARVLLTGATGGLGNAIARGLHARGAHLIVTGRREEQLQELAGELGERIEPVVADLADPGAVDALLGRAGRVDVFVANAALPGSGAIGSYSPEQIDRAIDVNLRAPMQITRAVTEGMLERGSGHVVLIGSMSGKVAAAYGSVYSATKFGLRGFGLSLADELHGTGVGVSLVSPGFIRDAGMYADSGVKLPPGVGTKKPEDVVDAVVRAIEKGRTEADVAPVSFRAGSRLYGVAPSLVGAIQRRWGGHDVAKALADAQADQR